MIDLRQPQRSFGEGLIQETVEELWEDWMRQGDAVLEGESLLTTVQQALQRRHPRSRTHGRPGPPAEVVLRRLLLKHIRHWSFAELEREVRANLLYREFTRIRAGKVPDAKTLGDWRRLWARKLSRRFMPAWWRWRTSTKLSAAAVCAWTPR